MIGGDPYGPYQPVQSLPDPDFAAGYEDVPPPPPPMGAQEAMTASYADQRVSMGNPGTMAPFSAPFSRMAPMADGAVRSALLGIAGAALASRPALRTSTLVKGAIGGIVACFLLKRRAGPGLFCTLGAAAGGFALVKFVK